MWGKGFYMSSNSAQSESGTLRIIINGRQIHLDNRLNKAKEWHIWKHAGNFSGDIELNTVITISTR